MMRAVQRILAVFDCYTSDRPSLTLQEIANRIMLPKATVFRIVQSLEQAGYLVRLENQQYCLSFRFTCLAGMVQSTLNIRQIARPVMIDLARQAGETVTLNIVNEHDRVCIEVIDTPSPLMSITKTGEHVRLVDGATAKTLMAYLAKEPQRKAIAYAVKASGKKRSTLAAELDRIRRQGYAVTHGERVLGLTAISAPIRDLSNESNYCITITGPTVRMRPREKDFVRLVVKAAGDISRRLGTNAFENAGTGSGSAVTSRRVTASL